mmetsp:Transcript_46217/g.128618  ORF Transcript_46217/g.128618 Transcript_46217/m.128618 type:complete len:223 (-) Transcript_46217:82-750(-)
MRRKAGKGKPPAALSSEENAQRTSGHMSNHLTDPSRAARDALLNNASPRGAFREAPFSTCRVANTTGLHKPWIAGNLAASPSCPETRPRGTSRFRRVGAGGTKRRSQETESGRFAPSPKALPRGTCRWATCLSIPQSGASGSAAPVRPTPRGPRHKTSREARSGRRRPSTQREKRHSSQHGTPRFARKHRYRTRNATPAARTRACCRPSRRWHRLHDTMAHR